MSWDEGADEALPAMAVSPGGSDQVSGLARKGRHEELKEILKTGVVTYDHRSRKRPLEMK